MRDSHSIPNTPRMYIGVFRGGGALGCSLGKKGLERQEKLPKLGYSPPLSLFLDTPLFTKLQYTIIWTFYVLTTWICVYTVKTRAGNFRRLKPFKTRKNVSYFFSAFKNKTQKRCQTFFDCLRFKDCRLTSFSKPVPVEMCMQINIVYTMYSIYCSWRRG